MCIAKTKCYKNAFLAGTTNPFALTIGNNKQAANPFHQPVQHVPINQLQNNTTPTMGFSQTAGGAILPTPLLPVSGAPPPMQSNAAGSNPFL